MYTKNKIYNNITVTKIPNSATACSDIGACRAKVGSHTTSQERMIDNRQEHDVKGPYKTKLQRKQGISQ